MTQKLVEKLFRIAVNTFMVLATILFAGNLLWHFTVEISPYSENDIVVLCFLYVVSMAIAAAVRFTGKVFQR
ncbi:MAG: hypothetical protein B7Z08_00335 [Sphingomonadales bacterium 32-68-7]|nr:MAG: hypothetical protein B7Z33_09235 [Sphingomonadales bacterium 12-68-11]OYX10576.1 MAG: hypothetical protein B7Z08_00335 [Sphingomonadales bacterium 32-68-7]